ncbi:MAG: hypothetical protein A2927_02005 [Candidatus Komeilibacteria bacterium RIFCSPLOWO2_01_FULL_45_10]|uniref:Uncharacterized protein n=1 Tax=Candidatus Komeilibacteria bacterium RIFCSPLOWO2_01_FULL_45_10 TaxID=1798550 RepID=A0A1G2BIH4_9BACT|nr:MAG: hypothetical protein A2927_02005 [Candidatus Komeilibacteria bacterium RIFCSPLOWO2_01_FULL_45_10]
MKDKKVSIILSLIFPGLGHFYIGKFFDGVIFLLGTGVLWFAIFYRSTLLLYFNNSRSYLVWGALLFIYLYSVVDVLVKTKKAVAGLSAKPLFIAGAMIIAVWVLYVGLGRGIIPNQWEYQKDQDHLLRVMKTQLPTEAMAEVKYPIQGYRIPGLGGYCWLESSAGLIKYLEPDIDFDTFVFYARPTLMMAGRNKNERWGPGINQIHAFAELGYTAFRGSINPTHLPQSVFPDIDPQNLVYFKSAAEELAFMKKLISAEVIPTIVYAGDFSTIVGYNQEGLWIVKSDPSQTDKPGRNFMTYPVVFEPTYITYQQLFKNWDVDYQFFWFEKTGQRKPIEEIYAENKKNAAEAPQNLRLIIDYLEAGGQLLDFTAVDIPSPIVLYRYFQKKGNMDIANQYLEMAKILDASRASLGPSPSSSSSDNREFYLKNLTEILPLVEKIATMWP